MMIPRLLRPALLGVGLLLAAPHAGAAEMTKSEVEKIVREYLLANPEILNEMLTELKARDEASADKKAKDAIASNRDTLLNDGYSYVAGNPNGDVTVVEFFDYRCGYCKKVRDDVVTVINGDSNLRFVFKEFPILGATSVEASRAAIAARKQGDDKYWAFHNAMLGADSLDSDAIYDIAGAQGIDVAKLKEDMKSPEIDDIIKKNHKLAEEIGVDGTPAFIVGDQLYPGALGADDIKAAVEQHRGG
jgi:protein-disulfide isomerase